MTDGVKVDKTGSGSGQNTNRHNDDFAAQKSKIQDAIRFIAVKVVSHPQHKHYI
tara:strand:+ start:1386 stop:1547 length:162 start_codon:yes stop_codon:yes gene_type:complete